MIDDVRVVEAPGDCNADGGVDLQDYKAFHDCLTGPNIAPGAGCTCFDLDHDDDVDLRDFGGFQTRYFRGPP